MGDGAVTRKLLALGLALLLALLLALPAAPAWAMQKYYSWLQDQSGRPISGATVTVYHVGTTTKATLYSDNGNNPTANPLTTEADGSFYFYAANGRYDLVFAATNITFDADDTRDLSLYDHVDATLVLASSLSVIPAGECPNPPLSFHQDSDTGLCSPHPDHVAVVAAANHVAVFHQGGLMAGINASYDIGTAAGSRFRHLHLTGTVTAGTPIGTASGGIGTASGTISEVDVNTGTGNLVVGLPDQIHVTGVMTGAGSATVPVVARQTNPVTGLFYPATDHLAATVGGEEIWRAHVAGLAVRAPLWLHNTSNLPTAHTAGRLIRRADHVRGVWMDQGSQWFGLNGEVANVKEFGAKGDGVTDDTTAIQAAINAILATSNGGIVYFPPGLYLVSSTLTVTTDSSGVRGIILLGAGMISSVLKCTANATCVNVTNPTFGYGFGMHDLGLRGPNAFALPYDLSTGLVLNKLQHPWSVSRSQMIYFATGVTVSTSSDIGVFSEMRVGYNDVGMSFTGTNSDFVRVSDSIINNNSTRQLYIAAKRVQISNTQISMGLDQEGIRIEKVADDPISVEIYSNDFEATTGTTVDSFIQVGTGAADSATYLYISIHDNYFAQNGTGAAYAVRFYGNQTGLSYWNNRHQGISTAALWFTDTMISDISVWGNTGISRMVEQTGLGRFISPPRAVAGGPNTKWYWGRALTGVSFDRENVTASNIIEDEVASFAGIRDAWSQTVTAASGPTGLRYSKVGDDTVWSVRFWARRGTSSSLEGFSFQVYNLTDAKYISRQRNSLGNEWREYVFSFFAPTGKTLNTEISGHVSGSATGTFEFTEPYFAGPGLSGTFYYIGAPGHLVYTAAGAPLWQLSLPAGQFLRHANAASQPSGAMIVNRADTTIAVGGGFGLSSGATQITVVSTTGMAVGDFLRIQSDAANYKPMQYNGATGYKITALPGAGVVQFTPAALAADRTGDGSRVQAYRIQAWPIAVIATASLPAAGAALDGTVIIEDAGAGDRNLIIYAGGQRFRIDGGTAF